MNLIYFYDFETTGFPLWKKPSSDPGQPHIVQCAAVMVDAFARKVVNSFDLTVKPQGWEIPDEAAEVHGITTDLALEIGIPEYQILANLFAFHRIAALRIGHNQPFDARIMRIALKRFDCSDDDAESWKAGESYCTQSKSTPIVKCPPSEKMKAAGRHGHKTASLSEAYQHFFGKPFEGAHTAMADVLATMAVYWAIMDLGPAEKAPEAKTQQELGGDGVGFL